MKRYIKDFCAHYPVDEEQVPVTGIGSVIGTHAGPGAIAVAYFSE